MNQRLVSTVICATLAAVSGTRFAGAGEAAAQHGPDISPAVSQEKLDVTADAPTFLDQYQKRFAALEIQANLAYWQAANSGKKEDFDASAQASLAMNKFHSDPEVFRRLRQWTQDSGDFTPRQRRALAVAELAFRRNQMPPELLEQITTQSSEIERLLATYRGKLDEKQWSNNDLLEALREANDSERRRAIWEALKQVGGVVAPRLRDLAELRNQGARQLGFANFWEMQIRLQEHDPDQLLALFDELERSTREPFTRMKAEMDRELAQRFGVDVDELMPWHHDNPFFQAPPPSAAVNLDEFYRSKTREEIVEIARTFYADIGLPVGEILRRSDLYEREGKDQHAFCMSVDRADDVRTLCNVKPTAEWMDTVLHELGHAVYDVGIDRSLPYNLREPAQAFTTEGVAMLFGALAKTPSWMVAYAGADRSRTGELSGAILAQRRREQLIFARWTMVMLHFEKALYEDPRRDLNSLWWDYVERFQQLQRPEGRDEPDWAATPHFTIAPVYYHSYMMGELFAAQLRHRLAKLAHHDGPTSELSFNGREEFGRFLNERVFQPGNLRAWPEFVREATGEPLTARYYAAEVSENDRPAASRN